MHTQKTRFFLFLFASLIVSLVLTISAHSEELSIGAKIYQKNVRAGGAIMTVLTSKIMHDGKVIKEKVSSMNFSGSCFFFDKTGSYILTCAHVVKINKSKESFFVKIPPYESIEVTSPSTTFKFLSRENKLYELEVLGRCEVADIAVAKVLGINEKDYDTSELNASDPINVGDQLWCIGCSEKIDLIGTIKSGILSNFKRVFYQDQIDVAQNDISLNSGNSGSPIFGSNNKVMGIYKGGLDYDIEGYDISVEGIGYHIPVNEKLIKKLAEKLKKGDVELPEIGFNTRVKDFMREINGSGSIDVEKSLAEFEKTMELKNEEKENFKTIIENPQKSFATIIAIKEGTQASDTFIIGDLVTHIDDNPVINNSDIMSAILLKDPGEEVKVKFLRPVKGRLKEMEAIIKLTKRTKPFSEQNDEEDEDEDE